MYKLNNQKTPFMLIILNENNGDNSNSYKTVKTEAKVIVISK